MMVKLKKMSQVTGTEGQTPTSKRLKIGGGVLQLADLIVE